MKDAGKPLAEEGYALMGAAFEVHRTLGGGLLEEIYQESLEIELELRGIPFLARQKLTVHYKDRRLKKRYIPDLFVFEQILVELKAVSSLTTDHEAQLMNYMRITRQPLGT
jgi:GxxExxY protein